MAITRNQFTNSLVVVCDACKLPETKVTLHRKGKKLLCSMCIMKKMAVRCQAKLDEINRKIAAEQMRRHMQKTQEQNDGQSAASGGSDNER